MKKEYQYKTQGTCSRAIAFSLEDGVISDVAFQGGCHGNLQGISRLVEGMTAQDAIDRLSGIRCGFKPTSCPDQLSKALKRAMEEE